MNKHSTSEPDCDNYSAGPAASYFSNSAEHPIRKDGNEVSTKSDLSAFRRSVKAGKVRITRKAFPREYNSWKNAKQRCRNPATKDSLYAGLKFDKTFDRFQSFLTHIGPMPSSEFTLDRINNKKGYIAGNVRWASKKTQATNRGSTILVSHAGETKSLKQWAAIFDLSPKTLYGRFQRGDRDPTLLFRPVPEANPAIRKIPRSPSRLAHLSASPKKKRPTYLNGEFAERALAEEQGRLMSVVKNHDTLRAKFFRVARRIEQAAHTARQEAFDQRLAQEADEIEVVLAQAKRLRGCTEAEGYLWRIVNGIGLTPELQKSEEFERRTAAEFLEMECERVHCALNKFTAIASKELGGKVNLRAIAKAFLEDHPEIADDLPDALAICLGYRRPKKPPTNSHLALRNVGIHDIPIDRD